MIFVVSLWLDEEVVQGKGFDASGISKERCMDTVGKLI
jgi:hypothetical protein